jgi:hypothetical protein
MMGKPEDIPQDVWDAAESTLDTMLSNHGYEAWRTDSIGTIARAILAAKAEERDAVRVICMDLQESFLSPEYATDQPLSSIGERFAIGRVIHALEARSVEVNTAHKNSEG